MKTTPANDNSAPNKIVMWEIRGKDRKQFGRHIPGEIRKGHHAEIVPGRSVRLFGLIAAGAKYELSATTGRYVPCEERVYRRDFRIGDPAVIGGFNLTYVGRIRCVTEKTISVVQYEGTPNEKVHRFDIFQFSQLNWDYDVEETARRNAEWTD